jgi:tetratricopeptide (TPR) repeat protein
MNTVFNTGLAPRLYAPHSREAARQGGAVSPPASPEALKATGETAPVLKAYTIPVQTGPISSGAPAMQKTAEAAAAPVVVSVPAPIEDTPSQEEEGSGKPWLWGGLAALGVLGVGLAVVFRKNLSGLFSKSEKSVEEAASKNDGVQVKTPHEEGTGAENLGSDANPLDPSRSQTSVNYNNTSTPANDGTSASATEGLPDKQDIDAARSEAELFHSRASVLDGEGKFDDAYRDYSKAIQLMKANKENPYVTYGSRAAMRFEQAKEPGTNQDTRTQYAQEAFGDMDAAIQNMPSNLNKAEQATYFIHRAKMHLQMPDVLNTGHKGFTNILDKARKDADKAISLDPNSYKAYYIRSQILLAHIAIVDKKGHHNLYEKALNDVNKAIVLAPEKQVAYDRTQQQIHELLKEHKSRSN